jgi:hypothetical protein
MKKIRQVVTCICVAATLSVSIPYAAETDTAPQGSEKGRTTMAQEAPKLDLTQLQKAVGWNGQAASSPMPLAPLKVQMQTSAGGRSGMSTAKKTWIIVGSIVGAAVVVAAVSNSGGGGGGY